MTFPGQIGLLEDRIEIGLRAQLTLNDAGDNITIRTKDGVLGSWPLADVEAHRQSSGDFLLTMGTEQVVFRPETEDVGRAFASATRPRSVSDRIRALPTITHLKSRESSAVSPPPMPISEIGYLRSSAQVENAAIHWVQHHKKGTAMAVAGIVALILFLTSSGLQSQNTLLAQPPAATSGLRSTASPMAGSAALSCQEYARNMAAFIGPVSSLLDEGASQSYAASAKLIAGNPDISFEVLMLRSLANDVKDKRDGIEQLGRVPTPVAGSIPVIDSALIDIETGFRLGAEGLAEYDSAKIERAAAYLTSGSDKMTQATELISSSPGC